MKTRPGTDAHYYLAGPMTGYAEYNFPAFAEAAKDLTDKGYTVVSPHTPWENDSMEQLAARPYGFYFRAALKMLLSCDHMFLLPGWMNSSGARMEAQIAASCGMDIILYEPNAEVYEVLT